MSDPQFIPQRIGDPDFPRMAKIREQYELLISDLAFLQSEIRHTKGEIPSTFEEIVGFLQSPAPLDFLTFLYIESRGIQFPGFSTQRLVEKGLVEVPQDDVDQAMSSLNMIKAGLALITKMGFVFPLGKLWGPYENSPGEYCFQLTQEFKETLEKHCSVFTRNEKQNIILPYLEKLARIMNTMHRDELINLDHGVTEFQKVLNLIDVQRLNQNPARVDKTRLAYAFKQKGDSYNWKNHSAASFFKVDIIEAEQDNGPEDVPEPAEMNTEEVDR